MSSHDGSTPPLGWIGTFTLDSSVYRTSPDSIHSDATAPGYGLIGSPVTAFSATDTVSFWYRYIPESGADVCSVQLRNPTTAHTPLQQSLPAAANWTYFEYTPGTAENFTLEFYIKFIPGPGGLWIDDVTLPGPASGTVNLPLVIAMYPAGAVGSLDLPITINVVSAAHLSGAASIGDGGTAAAVWGCFVMIDGVDVTGNVLGDVTIEADESSACIADFVLRPDVGTVINPPDWVGRPVTISVADISSGSPANSTLLFSGLVELPQLDIDLGAMKLSCSDNYQTRISALSRAELAALIGGYDSPAVFDAGGGSWTYAQDLLSTVPKALELTVGGGFRITPWAAKAVPDLSFDADTLLDGKLTVDLAQRSGLTNHVDIAFDYRFPRVKTEGHVVSLDLLALYATGFGDYVNDGNAFLFRTQVPDAIEAAGGTIVSVTYMPLPTIPMTVGGAMWLPNPATDVQLCLGFNAVVSFDYAQQTQEAHKIAVSCAKSIANVGLIGETMSGALEGKYPDISATETSRLLYKNGISGIPPLDPGTVVSGHTNATEVTLTADTNRAAANAAMQALIGVAMTKILKAHRQNTVSGALPLWPALTLDKTVHVDSGKVQATGKVVKVRHALSPASGTATTDISLAISSAAGVGVVHSNDGNTAPSGTTAASTALAGAPVVVFKFGALEDKSLTITFPGVEAAERQKANVTLPSSYAVAVPEDPLSIIF